jgi:hypothetical protein
MISKQVAKDQGSLQFLGKTNNIAHGLLQKLHHI